MAERPPESEEKALNWCVVSKDTWSLNTDYVYIIMLYLLREKATLKRFASLPTRDCVFGGCYYIWSSVNM